MNEILTDYTPQTVKACSEEYLVYISSVRNLSDNSVAAYRMDLAHLQEFLGADTVLSQVTLDDLKQCVGKLSRRKYSAASINRFIAAVRSLFAYCKKFHYIQNNVALELKTVRLPKRLPKYMTQGEVDAMCSIPEKLEILWPSRDKAIFEMFYSSGCRVGELQGLKFEDFASDYSSALVVGKGNKERRVFFAQDARNALAAYLSERDSRFPESRERVHNIFLNQHGTALTVHGIYMIVKRYSGVEGTNKSISPHAFRHTFATQMLSNGADIRMVQEMLGHSTISTTQRYTHVTTERLKEVYNQAFPHSGKED